MPLPESSATNSRTLSDSKSSRDHPLVVCLCKAGAFHNKRKKPNGFWFSPQKIPLVNNIGFSIRNERFQAVVSCSTRSPLLLHRVPGVLRPDEAFSLHQRRSSSDSNKASSGEVSPYDNNSPVLSERLLQCQVDRSDRGDSRALSDCLFRAAQGDSRTEQCSSVGHVKGQPGETCNAPDADRGELWMILYHGAEKWKWMSLS